MILCVCEAICVCVCVGVVGVCQCLSVWDAETVYRTNVWFCLCILLYVWEPMRCHSLTANLAWSFSSFKRLHFLCSLFEGLNGNTSERSYSLCVLTGRVILMWKRPLCGIADLQRKVNDAVRSTGHTARSLFCIGCLCELFPQGYCPPTPAHYRQKRKRWFTFTEGRVATLYALLQCVQCSHPSLCVSIYLCIWCIYHHLKVQSGLLV